MPIGRGPDRRGASPSIDQGLRGVLGPPRVTIMAAEGLVGRALTRASQDPLRSIGFGAGLRPQTCGQVGPDGCSAEVKSGHRKVLFQHSQRAGRGPSRMTGIASEGCAAPVKSRAPKDRFDRGLPRWVTGHRAWSTRPRVPAQKGPSPGISNLFRPRAPPLGQEPATRDRSGCGSMLIRGTKMGIARPVCTTGFRIAALCHDG